MTICACPLMGFCTGVLVPFRHGPWCRRAAAYPQWCRTPSRDDAAPMPWNDGLRKSRYMNCRIAAESLMERSFKKEVDALRLGAGQVFRGEGILAVTKALLQSGVSYVGGYQGAPVSHLLDVMVDAKDLLADLGVHVETCTNEASAAAMLGASINYPLRGAVTWKSIVGTNVAADALSNLSSPGVIGGALIVLGEDFGEGASVIQERSYAYAIKSSI